ncbi:MAG: Cdc6/Cdc18 family protein, partial [Candidatus Hodarchaeales archaeon]
SQGLNIYADYRNCWINRTRNSVLRGLLRDKFGISIRGFGSEEAIDVLIRRLSSDDAYLILILDEVSVLPAEDIENFLHLTEEFGAKHRFSVIMISRPSEWNILISPEISQRISDVIHFKPYSRDEIREILEFRASLAFKSTAYSEELLEMISEISDNTQNIRHGIEILHRAGRIADRKNESEIDPEMVRMARASVYPEMRPEILHDLSSHELYILLGITRQLLGKSYTAITIKEAYETYQTVCEEYGEDYANANSFQESIDNLETLSIISILDAKRLNDGDKKRITIHDVPAAVLKERIEFQITELDNE